MRETFVFRNGDRIIVGEKSHSFAGAKGTVSDAPGALPEWEGHRKIEAGVDGPIVLYWVIFDNPYVSPVSSNPCEAAAIAGLDLVPLP